MVIRLPPQKGKELSQLTQTLTKALQPAVMSDQPTPRLILQSPNGTNYTITIEDDGTLRVRDSRSVPL